MRLLRRSPVAAPGVTLSQSALACVFFLSATLPTNAAPNKPTIDITSKPATAPKSKTTAVDIGTSSFTSGGKASADENQSSTESDAPPDPNSFIWVDFPTSGTSRFLRPPGWHVDTQTTGEKSILTISRETPTPTRAYITAFTVIVIPSTRPHADPKAKVDSYVEQTQAKGQLIHGPTEMPQGNFYGKALQQNVEDPRGRYVVRHLAAENRRTGTFYVFIFEAPVGRWDSDWANYGSIIFKRLSMDQDF